MASAYTTDPQVRRELSEHLLPLLAIYIIADAVQYCCNGVMQGCGTQKKAYPWVLAAYYLVGLPLSFVLGGLSHRSFGFGARWGPRGMVGGMVVGKLFHATAFSVLTWRTCWDAEVQKASLRVSAERAKQEAAEQSRAAAAAAASCLELEVAEGYAGDVEATPANTPERPTVARPVATGAVHGARAANDARVAPKAAKRYAQLVDEA